MWLNITSFLRTPPFFTKAIPVIPSALLYLADYEYFEERTAVAPANFGQGFVPIAQAVEVLRAGDYRGYLAFDPAEIPEDSDVAIAEAIKLLKDALEKSAVTA